MIRILFLLGEKKINYFRIGREIADEILRKYGDKVSLTEKQLEDIAAKETIIRIKKGDVITSLKDSRIEELKRNPAILFEGHPIPMLKNNFDKALERERKRKESENNNKQKTGYFNSQSTNAIAFDPSVYENLSYDDRVYYQGDEPTAIWDKDDEDVTKQDELEFKVFNR